MISMSLMEKKERGHALLDELESLGVNKFMMYRPLAHHLGVKEKYAHFRYLNDPMSLDRAVRFLEKKVEKRRRALTPKAAPVKVPKHDAVYTNKFALRAVAIKNQMRPRTFLKRIPLYPSLFFNVVRSRLYI